MVRPNFQIRDLHGRLFRYCDSREANRLLALGLAVRWRGRRTVVRLVRPASEIYRLPERGKPLMRTPRRPVERILGRRAATGRSYVIREPIGEPGSGLFAYRHDLPRGWESVPAKLPTKEGAIAQNEE